MKAGLGPRVPKHLLVANLGTRRVVDRPAVVPTSAEFCFGMNSGARRAPTVQPEGACRSPHLCRRASARRCVVSWGERAPGRLAAWLPVWTSWGNYAEVSADFSSSGLQKSRPVTPSSAKDHCGVCNPYIPIPAEMTGRFSSPQDETRVRADAERRLLQPRDDAEAGCAKDLPSFGRGNGDPPNRRPELRGEHHAGQGYWKLDVKLEASLSGNTSSASGDRPGRTITWL